MQLKDFSSLKEIKEQMENIEMTPTQYEKYQELLPPYERGQEAHTFNGYTISVK